VGLNGFRQGHVATLSERGVKQFRWFIWPVSLFILMLFIFHYMPSIFICNQTLFHVGFHWLSPGVHDEVRILYMYSDLLIVLKQTTHPSNWFSKSAFMFMCRHALSPIMQLKLRAGRISQTWVHSAVPLRSVLSTSINVYSFSFFVVCLMTLSVIYSTWHLIIWWWWIMNWKRMWKVEVVA
jgi:hypothetical protein